jgi:hypothetical protein
VSNLVRNERNRLVRGAAWSSTSRIGPPGVLTIHNKYLQAQNPCKMGTSRSGDISNLPNYHLNYPTSDLQPRSPTYDQSNPPRGFFHALGCTLSRTRSSSRGAILNLEGSEVGDGGSDSRDEVGEGCGRASRAPNLCPEGKTNSRESERPPALPPTPSVMLRLSRALRS